METLEKSPPDGEPIFDPEGRANFPVDLTVEADSEGYQCSATLKTVSFSLTSFSIEDLELGKGDGDTSLKFDCSFSFQHVGVSGSAQVSKDFKVGGFSLPSPFSLAEVRGGPAAQVAENGSSAARRNRSEGRRSSRAGITVDGEAKTRISGKFHFGMEGGVDSCDCEGTVCLAVHFDSLHLGVGEFELDQGNTTVTIDLPTGIPIGDLEERIQDFKHGIEDKIVEKLTDPEALPAIVNQFSESMSNTLQKLHFDLPCMKII